jgi:single-strand DNA-binding protein
MAQRSLNKVQLIGNLTRDPELRYTPQGTAVCTFGLATNRQWQTEAGEKREETEFHRIVAWNKLAELCSQLLFKGRRVYLEGRLQTRRWTGQDGAERQTTEIVIEEMMILDSKRAAGEGVVPAEEAAAPPSAPEESAAEPVKEEKKKKPGKKSEEKAEKTGKEEEVKVEDIPF